MKYHLLNQWYQHRDGGIYYTLHLAASTVDGSPVIVYKHIFPFESAVWVRPLSEWTVDRFKPISASQANDFMTNEREAMQRQIAEHKAARRAAA